MKKELVLLLGIGMFFVISLGISSTVEAQSCSGTFDCSGLSPASSCNSHDGCSWSGGSCSTEGSCSDFSDETSCSDSPGCNWESGDTGETSSSTGGGGTAIQEVVGISPEFPLGGDDVRRGKVQLKIKVYHGGEPVNRAEVHANSTMFGLVEMKHEESYSDGVYTAQVTIGEDAKEGRNRIFYRAAYSGEFNQISMLVNVRSGINIDTQIGETYYKGEPMSISGKITDLNGTAISNSSVTIKGFYQGARTFILNTETDESGNFAVDRITHHAEPEGEWDIDIVAESPDGKIGIDTVQTEVDVSPGTNYYNVKFLSPLEGEVYTRGERIPVSIQVTDIDGSPVEGAEVTIHNTKEQKTSLEEVDEEEGIYSGDYVLENDALKGKWILEAEVSKTEGQFTRVGGAGIPITVGSADMNIEVISPSEDTISTNTRLKIRLHIEYPDDSHVKGADAKAIISGKNVIELTETREGTYTGEYFVDDEESPLNLRIEVEDTNGNTGTLDRNLAVRNRTILGNMFAYIYYFITKYWLAFFLFILLTGYFSKPFAETKYYIWRINKLEKNNASIKKSQEKIERKYYEKGAMSEKRFENLKNKYDKKFDSNESKIKELKEKLSDRVSGFKKKNKKKKK